MIIDEKTKIKDIVNMGSKAIGILMSFGMSCIGCPSSQNERIGDAAAVHGINLENLLQSLNSI
jgi:hybrid cluster-associated redox disulfide protein